MSGALQGKSVLIAGAGIGGLAAALAFRQRGASVTVLEQAEAISEVGAGLQISPNGLAVLRALGVADEVAQPAVQARAVVLRDYRRAGEVAKLNLAKYAPDQTYLFVHRADLIAALAQAVRASGVQIRLLQNIQSVEPGPDPAVRMANGSEKSADIVVGADGVRSVTRTALNGADTPRFTKQVAWRAIVPNDLGLPAQAQLFMGPGRHLVCYPLRGGSCVNIVAVREQQDWAEEGWHHKDDPDNLRRAFYGFEGTAHALLQRVEDVGLWGLFRHPVAPSWHKGRVAILGDAAHPTLPFLAQGANLALEDAWVLADSLDRAETTGAGLLTYQIKRHARATRAIRVANGNAWRYHLSLPPVRGAAHLALKLGSTLAPKAMLGQFDWLYRHDVTA